jgi:hypothetical protein
MDYISILYCIQSTLHVSLQGPNFLIQNITEIIGEQFVILQRKDPSATNAGNEAFESNSDLNLDSKGLPY